MTYNGEYRPQDDMVVGYHLENLYDFSGNIKTLTNNGSLTFSELARPDGTTGKVAAFGSPNSTKYLQATSTSEADIDISLTSNPITLAGWIRITALPSSGAYPTILHWDAHQTDDRYVALWYKNDGGTYKLQADFSGNVTTYSVTLTVDTWYWVVLTAATGAGGATALYLNGVLVATGTKGTSAGAGTTYFQIGKHLAQAQYWPGYLYQVAAFKKVFTATEILDWYNYQIGTEYPGIYIQLNETKLNPYLSTEEGMAADGGELNMEATPAASLDYASMFYGGRNERIYSFRLLNDTRSTIDSLLNLINNSEEMDIFTPHCKDRIVYVKKAQAIIGSPQMHWPVTEGRWYYFVNCKIYAVDQFQYGFKKNIFVGENFVVPTESVTVTNNGTYKSGLDHLKASGYYDSGGPTYSTDLTLTMNDKAMLLCDKLLHGDEFTIDRYGKISHKIYTDFDLAITDLQNYFDGADSAFLAATAGYHLGGINPLTNLAGESGTDNGFLIKVDAEINYSHIDLTKSNCTTLPTTAAEMQTRIRALGGSYAAVTVVVEDGRFKITSGTTGVASKVRIASSEATYGDSVCYRLKIGTGISIPGSTTILPGEDHDGTAAATPYIYLGEGSYGSSQSGSIAAGRLNRQGYHVSGLNPETVLTGHGTSGKLKIQNDAEASATEITLTLANCTSAATTAAEIQTRIRAIGAAYAKVRVIYEDSVFTIISQTFTATSTVVITPGDTYDISAALKLGTANGGTTYASADTLKFNIQADTEASPTEVTINPFREFTNDLASGTNITINIANTDIFVVGDLVYVRSTAGSEYATINQVTPNTSIRVNALALNHTTSERWVAGFTDGVYCAREIEDAIQALGGAYAAVTCVYSLGRYIITSGTSGSDSKIRITDAATTDAAERMLFGVARGGSDTDGISPTIAKNACVLTSHGGLTIPFYGPLISSSPPYIEFVATAIEGSPKAVYIDDDGAYIYMPDEIVQGYNKIWFPALQAVADIRIGIYCDESDYIALYDLTAEVRRDVSASHFPKADPSETMEFALSCGGSLKLSEVELFYRDAFWS